MIERVLVTGLGGFIGRRTVPFLLERGFEVHGVGRGAPPPSLDPRVKWTTFDLFDHRRTIDEVLALAPSHCLHLAWHVEQGRYWRAPENLACVQASLNLFAAFVKAGGRRFVGAGTCAEYDWSYGFFSEALTPRTPHTPFGRCKNALFEAIMAHAEVAQVSAAWGRIFFLYGPNEIETRLVPSVITNLIAGRPAKTSHGEQLRDFSYVDDVAGSLVALLASEVTGGVNIASGKPVAVRTIVETIAKKIGRPELLQIGAIPPQPGEPPLLVADVRRLVEEVGFRPRWTLESGLDTTIANYRK